MVRSKSINKAKTKEHINLSQNKLKIQSKISQKQERKKRKTANPIFDIRIGLEFKHGRWFFFYFCGLLFFFFLRGCPGQFARTTTNLTAH
jgi:hypothetical protein